MKAKTDPVIRAYMRHVDRTLLRENLKLTPAERLEKFVKFAPSRLGNRRFTPSRLAGNTRWLFPKAAAELTGPGKWCSIFPLGRATGDWDAQYLAANL
jgi:hypothetical protein